MDKLQWFKFVYADWRMGKIQRCPETTQARFINLCCLYWSKDCILTVEDAEIEIDKVHLYTLVDKKIVVIDGNYVYIKFLDEQKMELSGKSKSRSDSGVIGNLKRWHLDLYKQYMNNKIGLDEAVKLSQTDRPPIATRSQNIAEKRRGEERRGDNPKGEGVLTEKEEATPVNYINLLAFFNTKRSEKLPKSKGILVISDNVKAQYKKRIKEGYDKQQIAWSIENAFNDKFFAENNYKHLTIGYFSRANTLDLYGTEPILTKKDKEEWDW